MTNEEYIEHEVRLRVHDEMFKFQESKFVEQMEAMDKRFSERFDHMNDRFTQRFEHMDDKFSALNSKVTGLYALIITSILVPVGLHYLGVM